MQNIREVMGEIEELPEPLLEEVLHFVRFLKSQASQERF